MDKVEAFLLVQPFVFEVFDDELHVRGDPVWLDGADVVSDYLGGREFPVLCELQISIEV